jgi:tetratricopeptide (TPR) repeat protein
MAAYDAFVSYSHAKDKPIAAALQSVMQRLGKPWYRRRALRVFRDDTSLSATPSLWPSIEQALGNSRFMILLASPEAAASAWVNREISFWLDNKRAETLLIALTAGELAWDNVAGGFAFAEDTPLPPALMGRFASEPKWVDLRAYREGADKRDARFTEHAADFAAAIHAMPKEDLLSHEVRQQRRALTLAWSAAGSLLILAGLAGWQWKVAIDNERLAIEQRQLAQEQRDRAERALAAATKTANSLVIDLAREFRDRAGMPADLVRRILERAQGLQRQLANSGESTPALRYSEVMALLDLVDTLLALGDTKAALAAAQRARSMMADLAASDPGNAGWQRDLSVSFDQVGDVRRAAGDRAGALSAFEESLAIRRKLAASDPGNAGWQRDLSVSFERVGDVRLAADDRAGALSAYEESLAIMRKLAASDPGNAGGQADVASSLRKLSTVSEPARARAALHEALAIVDTLARDNRLTAAQKNWPQLLRAALAKLPPETAGAQ